MNVGNLIERLEKFNKEVEVVFNAEEFEGELGYFTNVELEALEHKEFKGFVLNITGVE